MSQQLAQNPEYAPEIHSVQALTLSNFRNHTWLSLKTDGKSVVLYGSNGAGKTNILEAISMLAPGRGFRRSKLTEMDALNTNVPWVVSAEINGTIGDTQIGTGRELLTPALEGSSERRAVRVNGTTLKSPNQLSEYLSILWLTPQMDQLFLEGGTARRKFLDRLVYGFEPAHAARINRFELAMRERNKLLAGFFSPLTPPVNGGGKNVSPASGRGKNWNDWLVSVEAQMSEYGSAIAFARQQAVDHINQVMLMSELHFPKAHLALSGDVERAIQQGAAAIEVEKLYQQLLINSRSQDAQSGRTSVGVHRAEFSVQHIQKKTEAAYCSTGEQKALLLAIVLAEARSCSLWHGHVPILLLDEVAAHLDPQKRRELYIEIQELKAQVWMSGVSCDLFEEMHDNTMLFRVESGKIFTP